MFAPQKHPLKITGQSYCFIKKEKKIMCFLPCSTFIKYLQGYFAENLLCRHTKHTFTNNCVITHQYKADTVFP